MSRNAVFFVKIPNQPQNTAPNPIILRNKRQKICSFFVDLCNFLFVRFIFLYSPFPVPEPVFARVDAEFGLKDLGKSERVVISAFIRNTADRVIRPYQELGSSLHSRRDQVFLGRHPHLLFHELYKIASGDPDALRQVPDPDLFPVVVVDKPRRVLRVGNDLQRKLAGFSLLSVAMIIFIIIRKLVFGDPTAGWPSLVCILFFISGVQMLCLGAVGKYLEKTYLEVKNRPVYIVREKF